MTLQIAICDDSKTDVQDLRNLLTVCSIQMNCELYTVPFLSGKELLDSIQSTSSFPYQLIFLDIEMPEENGINIAGNINRLMPPNTFLVFVSNYPVYMGESFSVHPFHFLQKPVTKEQLKQLLTDIQDRLGKARRQFMIVSKDHEEVSLPIDQVLYITLENSKLQQLCIHTWDEFFLKKGTLAEMGANAPELLCPLNRTTLVNLLHVHYLSENNVILDNGISIHVSVRCKKNLIKLLKTFPIIHF